MSTERVRIFRSSVDHKYRHFIGNPEVKKQYEAGGIISPQEGGSIDAITVLNEVLGIAKGTYNLRALCRVLPMNNLKETIDIATGSTVQKKVPALTSVDLSALDWDHVDFDLWKNVGKIAIADESQMKQRHPQMQLNIEQLGYDLAAAENEQIAVIAEKCTEKVPSATYSDWGAVTSGISNTNPLSAITAHINAIEKSVKRPVDVIAMHPSLCDKFVQNTFVRDLIWAGMAKFNDTSTGGYFKLPNRPQITVITDLNLTETPDGTHGPILASTTAPGIVFGEGPTMAAQYRDEDIGADMYKIMQWLEPKIVRDAALSKICT